MTGRADFLNSGAKAIPGYTGHVPAMRNFVVGQTYQSATVAAGKAADTQRLGVNPASMSELVDQRPQGRQYLYAQVAHSIVPEQAPSNYVMPTPHSASLPELTFKRRDFADRKTYSEEVPEIVRKETQRVPGYTGHMHASQHMFGQSFGRVARDLVGSSIRTNITSRRLCEFGEDRPQGEPLQGDGMRIPGYTGIIRSKDNHIYGHTYADSTKLALKAVATIEEGGNASALPELTDYRPIGRVDLYTQRGGDKTEMIYRHIPSYLVTKSLKFASTRKTYANDAGIKEVNAAKHMLPGYTGHLRGGEELYAGTYGKLSRTLLSRSR